MRISRQALFQHQGVDFASIMDASLRQAFGRRLKDLRKLRQWTQKDLADKIGIRFSHLNKYEGGVHVPPAEKLVQLAEIFDTTVDFLLTGDRSDDRPLHHKRILERFRALETMKADDQDAVLRLIDAMIIKHRVQGAVAPVGKRAAAG
jgi:transcriptional regulator with XRE-family HTH domain